MESPGLTGTISQQTRVRDEICLVGKSLFDRGLTAGSSGNLSVRLDDGSLIVTPTNACLGELDPALLTHLTANGTVLSGAAPTKEAGLHSCVYCQRPSAGAVVHLHSTHSVAVSLLPELPPENVLPPLTAYYVMRVGTLPLVPYFPPGDPALFAAVEAQAKSTHAMLLSNHGPVVAGKTLRDAQYATEELEETAKLYLLVGHRQPRMLTPEQVAHLSSRK